MARQIIRPLREAGPLPLMALEHALDGVTPADLIRLIDAGMFAVFTAPGSDELLANRPSVEMGLEVVKACKARFDAA